MNISLTRDEAINKIILMLVGGNSTDAAEAACVASFPQPEAHDLVVEAGRRIALAASYDLTREIGTAYLRLNTLYAKALTLDDVKVALATQREMNRLLRLYDLRPESPDPDTADSETAAVAAHLLPLGLVPDDHPLREHARVAAEMVRQHLAATAAPPEPAPAEPAPPRTRRR
jgi:hypothetical protein